MDCHDVGELMPYPQWSDTDFSSIQEKPCPRKWEFVAIAIKRKARADIQSEPHSILIWGLLKTDMKKLNVVARRRSSAEAAKRPIKLGIASPYRARNDMLTAWV